MKLGLTKSGLRNCFGRLIQTGDGFADFLISDCKGWQQTDHIVSGWDR
jgi:hypothetical protein